MKKNNICPKCGKPLICIDCGDSVSYSVQVRITPVKFALIRKGLSEKAGRRIQAWLFAALLGSKSKNKRALDVQIYSMENGGRNISKKVSSNAIELEKMDKDRLLSLINNAENSFPK